MSALSVASRSRRKSSITTREMVQQKHHALVSAAALLGYASAVCSAKGAMTSLATDHARTIAGSPVSLQRRRRLDSSEQISCQVAKPRIPWSRVVAQVPRGGAFGRKRASTSAAADAAIHIPPADATEDAEEEVESGDGKSVVDDAAEEGGGVAGTEENDELGDTGEDIAGENGDDDSHDDEEDSQEIENGGEGDEEASAKDVDEDEASPDEASSDEASPTTAKRPTAPLFSFPPGPRVDRTEAEESLQEVLPLQQRLVKYLTEDKVFGAQILCSLYFLASAVAFSTDSDRYRGCYQTALASLMIKQWGTVIGRVQRVLVPHLLYEPKRYAKYRARVSALALDPAVQGLIYCFIFLFMPLGKALIPLALKESVYMLWVAREVLNIASPGLVGTLTSILEAPLSLFMTAGDAGKWRGMAETDKRLLLGRRLAQVCFKLEMLMPFSMALQNLPGVLQATMVGGVISEGREGVTTSGGGMVGHFSRMLPLVNFIFMMMAYVKLLTVKNRQLEDDMRIMRGLKIRGYNCEWVEQMVDSIVFGKMVGCPWWAGMLASLFSLLPNHEGTKTVMASENKLKTAALTLLNLAIGRTPGAEEEEEEDEDNDLEATKSGDGDKESSPTKLAKMAKVAAVATGITDS